jgi:glutaredoxin-related protein
VREEIKSFSAWPTVGRAPCSNGLTVRSSNRLSNSYAVIKPPSTARQIPQCYINGEFVGGSDILLELFESGELEQMVSKLKA